MLIFSILNHPCSFLVYFYFFSAFLSSKLIFCGFLHVEGYFAHRHSRPQSHSVSRTITSGSGCSQKFEFFSLANETQCALGIKLQSTAHFRRVINCNVVVFKNQCVYKRTCFSFELFERRLFISEENMLSL